MRNKNKSNHNPSAPTSMPREEQVEGEPVVTPSNLSPLGIYMKTAGISMGAFARAIGVSEKTAIMWRDGLSLPSGPAMYEIERLTKGVIPMEAWMSVPQAKKVLLEMREKQPPGLRKVPSGIPEGGFASPAEDKGNASKTSKITKVLEDPDIDPSEYSHSPSDRVHKIDMQKILELAEEQDDELD